MGRYVFKLPDIGEGTAEAELVAWHVAVGDTIKEDQHIVDVMTDKANVEIPAPVAGKVLSLIGTPGEMLPVGSEILVLEVPGAENAEGSTAEEAGPAAAPESVSAQPTLGPSPRSESPSGGGRGHYVFKLPDIGEGTAEAELVAWHVAVGDTIKEDQHIVDVMTDKANVEISTPVGGKIVSITGEPGQTVAVGSEILVLEVEGLGNVSTEGPAQQAVDLAPPTTRGVNAEPAGSSAPAPKSSGAAAQVGSSAQRRSPLPGSGSKPGFATRTPGEKPVASPAVRRKAWEEGIELQFVPGSGPGGRITSDDLAAFIQLGGHGEQPAATTLQQKHGIEEVKIIGLRRKIAERMQDAKRRIPHFSYIEEVDVTALEDMRAQFNAKWGKERGKLTLLPFLMKAITRALGKFPQINARFDDDAGVVRRYEGVHIGIATQTPTGLVVPVVQHAEALDLWASAVEVARLAQAAREGKATRDELSGSTISITSLGALGGIATTPVINYPEVAIIGVNKMIERPVIRDGQIVVRKVMNLSSSFDHRVVDGWDAAEFVQRVRGQLEQPALLFVD